MGLRERLVRFLSRGEPDHLDPDEFVPLDTVGREEGQLLAATLERNSVPCHCVEANGLDPTPPDYGFRSTLWIRRADRERAQRLIDRYRTPGLSRAVRRR